MAATEGASTSFFQTQKRLIMVVVIVASLLGTAIAGFFFKRHADVWMRQPPRMPQCVLISQRMLAHQENVSGSIPHVAPDGTMVYLRPTEDRAVRCVGRLSSSTASHFAAAFGEIDPEKRARALAAILRDHVSTQTSADSEALAAYLIASAGIRALPKSDETDKLRKELQDRNACRFEMRSQCPQRPPIPYVVWIVGIPSLTGLVVSLGWGLGGLVGRIKKWREKRRQEKAKAAEAPESSPAVQD
jgi:hypothetical protein